MGSGEGRVAEDVGTPEATAPSGDEGASVDTAAEDWGWKRSHRIGIGLLVGALLVFLVIQYLRRPYRLDDPIVIVNGKPVELPVGIDPNHADAAGLSRVPRLSESLARAIVDYRDAHVGGTTDGVVFRNLDDLRRVKGVGKKTLEFLRPFLVFPGDTTQPAPAPRGMTGPRKVPDPPEEGDEEIPE